MRIHTKSEYVWIHGSLILVHEEGFSYVGPLALCGGGQVDPVAQQQEEAQASFDQTLTQLFSQQYASQKAQLDYLNGKMQPIINAGGTGYTPEQLASMRTGATDTNAEQFQSAEAALNNQITQNSGGSKLSGVAGSTTQAKAELLAAEAQTQAGSQQAITSQNAQLQQSNYWNAINALNGVAAQENPLGYASAATSGSGAVAGLSQANSQRIQATTSPIMGALGGMIGGAAGGLFQGAGAAGSFGALFCWVAASFYGWDDIKTWVIRSWMKNSAPEWFSDFYRRHGEYIAKTPMRWMYRPVFEAVLARAA